MAKKLEHLMLATLEDVSNPLAWSGSAMAIHKALEDSVEELSVLSNPPVKRSPVHAALRLALGGTPPRYPLWMTKPALQDFARRTAAMMTEHKPQALLCISSQCLIYLSDFYRGPRIPIFSFSDAPWKAWHEVYKGYLPSPIGLERFAEREREGLRKADGLIYGSEWARQDAIKRFDVSPDSVFVRPLGAAWVPEQTDAELESIVRNRPKDRVDLLFLGREWERKGGPLALDIALALQSSGKVGDVTLHVVGTEPPSLAPEHQSLVKTYGFLNREVPEEREVLRKLLLSSHFMVVPTLAECFGLMFAEAQAFCLPAIARAVDAVPSIVKDGETGILQPRNDDAAPYVQRIVSLLSGDREAYIAMAMKGRAHFKQQFTWERFGYGIKRIIETSLPFERTVSPTLPEDRIHRVPDFGRPEVHPSLLEQEKDSRSQEGLRLK